MDNNNYRNIKIFVFRAIDEIELCKEYLKGHLKVLSDYGIENITTNNNLWISNPNVYCVVARDMNSNHLLGGARIQVADGESPLPVELAVGYMDTSLYEKVQYYSINGGVGESCGLWIAKEASGLGISRYLMWGSISSANQLHFSTMLGICASYTLNLFSDIGFKIDYSLGNKGGFPYPNNQYIANVIGILDAVSIATASKKDKDIMLSLRENPIQHRMEENKGNYCNVYYNLVYSSMDKTHFQIA